jgi:hypothetical protein
MKASKEERIQKSQDMTSETVHPAPSGLPRRLDRSVIPGA